MVELFCKNSEQLLRSNFFWKIADHKCKTVLPVKKNNSYFIYFYKILYDFINCPAFVDVKQTLH